MFSNKRQRAAATVAGPVPQPATPGGAGAAGEAKSTETRKERLVRAFRALKGRYIAAAEQARGATFAGEQEQVDALAAQARHSAKQLQAARRAVWLADQALAATNDVAAAQPDTAEGLAAEANKAAALEALQSAKEAHGEAYHAWQADDYEYAAAATRLVRRWKVLRARALLAARALEAFEQLRGASPAARAVLDNTPLQDYLREFLPAPRLSGPHAWPQLIELFDEFAS